MAKMCIFDKATTCKDCGECDVCELNNKKRCDNCGKCLELEGYDIKAINIDEIFENDRDRLDYEELDELHGEANSLLLEEDELPWEYIDDIRDLSDLLEEDKELFEEYPGLINLNKNRRE